MRWPSLIALAIFFAAPSAPAPSAAQTVPAAIFTDSPADPSHPAKMAVLHISYPRRAYQRTHLRTAGRGTAPDLGDFSRLARERKKSRYRASSSPGRVERGDI